MKSLSQQIEKTLQPGMHIPEPLARLFNWIESNGFHVDRKAHRLGFLYSPKKSKEEWTETQRTGGTSIQFHAEGNVNMKYWLGHDRPEVINRLCVFAQTGAEGSMAAFWLDDEGQQQIVHLGSGSGSVMVCILAKNAVDFLRLLAIGYDEICWDSAFDNPPNTNSEMFIHPNVLYQNWVKDTFKVTLPKTASEIVQPARMGDDNSHDVFCKWVQANNG
jgi:hypothetical protein